MKIIIDIPNEFTGDYIADKFKDFFSRVIADIDCKGLCGNYEKEIAEMFIKAFENSEDEYGNGYKLLNKEEVLFKAQHENKLKTILQKYNIDEDVINEIIKEYYSKNGGY